MFNKFFNPKSVAIVGASNKPGKVGYVIAENFSKDYNGNVFFVNSKPNPIFGKIPYSSISKIKDSIDLVIISVPAKFVPQIVEECVNKKVPSIVIITAGFSEIGLEGKKLEDKIKKIISGTNTRIIGPNVVGVYNPSTNVDTVFLPKDRMKRTKKGNIAFISQSGAVASTIIDWLAEEGIGISKFVSYGNAIDINESDLLEYLGNDKETKVIAVYMEGIKSSGKKFIETLNKVSKKKPIIFLKSGKTKSGSIAASSHTGSLAGSSKIYSTVFNQFGGIEALDWEELIDFIKAFSLQPLPKGNNLLIITNGGGFGVLAADEAERQNLNLKPLSKSTIMKIKNKIRPNASLRNPVDLTADSDASMYNIVFNNSISNYDGAIIITLFQVPTLDESIIKIILDMKKSGKPVLCCASGGKFTSKISKIIEGKGIPVYPTPRRAVSSFGTMVRYMKKKKY